MTKFKISVLSYISETAEAIRRQILYTSIGYIKLHVQSVERTKFHKKNSFDIVAVFDIVSCYFNIVAGVDGA